MKRMIIAVGGTGQMVLHYYLQLYLLGVIQKPFRAVVIDTDEILPSLRAVSAFLENLQYGPDKTSALGAELPTITTMRPDTKIGETLTEILTGRRSLEGLKPHPAQAFFDRDTLEQNLMRGLFARPALSSVLSQSSLKTDKLRPSASSTVVLVGSVIGGTGGGLMAPLIDMMHAYQVREGIPDVKVRGVFFGQYFRPESGRLEGDVYRFKSSQMLVLNSMRDALKVLHSFYIVGGGRGGEVERHPEEEKKAENLAWPENGNHPFWEGVRAVEYLLEESAKERASDFRRREFDDVDSRPGIATARLRLLQASQIARTIVRRDIIARLCREHWLETVWGSSLPGLLAHFWRIALKIEGGNRLRKTFPGQVQRRYRKHWEGDSESLGLEKVLPVPDESSQVRPGHIRSIAWPEPKTAGSQDRRLFEGVGNAADRLAASLLFWTLREGELR